jgi:glutamate racemase
MDVLPTLLPANLNDKNELTSTLCPVHYSICGSAKKKTDVVVVAPPSTITMMIMKKMKNTTTSINDSNSSVTRISPLSQQEQQQVLVLVGTNETALSTYTTSEMNQYQYGYNIASVFYNNVNTLLDDIDPCKNYSNLMTFEILFF